jgi:type II secretory pathway component PulC
VWRIRLDTFIQVLTKLRDMMKDVRIRPYFALGKTAGIQVDRIRKGSIIERLGLKDKDVIKGINGFGLMTPTRIFEAYRKYKKENILELQLIRDGETVELTYNIIR